MNFAGLGVASSVDFYHGAPAAESYVAARGEAGVVGLGPEVKAEEAAEIAQSSRFVRAVRPEAL